jgi:hypothetical protein
MKPERFREMYVYIHIYIPLPEDDILWSISAGFMRNFTELDHRPNYNFYEPYLLQD